MLVCGDVLFKSMSDEADTIKSGRLFHTSITQLLKKYLVVSIVLSFALTFYTCYHE